MIVSKYQNRNVLSKLDIKKWKLVKFNDLFIDETSKATKIKKEDYLGTGEFPIIDQGKDFIAGYTDSTEGVYKNAPLIIFGDHTRALKYIDFPIFIGADGVKLLKNRFPEEEVLTKYLYYYLCTVNIPDTGYNRHFKYLKEVIIPIPEFETQKQIIEVLDKAQELIDKRKAQIEALDQLTQSVFLEMFGDPFSNVKEWEKGRLEDLVVKITDGEHNNPVFLDNGYPMIMAKNVQSNGINFEDISYISKEDLNQFRKKCNPENGDVLVVSRGATIGRTCVVDTDVEFALMGSVILIKINSQLINPIFLKELLSHPYYKNKLLNTSGSSAQQAIYLKDLKRLEIITPKIKLQNEYAEVVKQIQKRKILMEKGIKLLEDNFNSLMQRAFKGELFTEEKVSNL